MSCNVLLFNKPWHLIYTISEFYFIEVAWRCPTVFLNFTHMAKLIFIVVSWLTVTSCTAGTCQHWFHNHSWILDPSLEYSTA
jgi:hypothetical protein